MKKITRNTFKPLQVLAAALATTSAPALCRAQEAPAATPATQQPQAAPLLDESSIRDEKSLQIPVTFEARRQKLPEVLAALQAQSGITLTVAADSPYASKLLTARAKAMPLAKVLALLCRTYSAAWARQGAAFEMRSNGRGILDNSMWKLLSTWENTATRAMLDPIDWTDEIANLGAARLQKKDGLPFEEVSEEVRQKLRAQLEGQDVSKLALALQGASLAALEGSTAEITGNESEAGTMLTIMILSPDGKPLSTKFLDVPAAAK